MTSSLGEKWMSIINLEHQGQFASPVVRPIGSDFRRSQFAKYFETFRSLLAYSSPLVASTACKVPSSRISVLSEAESKVRGLQDVASPRWPVIYRCSVRFTRPSPRCLRSGARKRRCIIRNVRVSRGEVLPRPVPLPTCRGGAQHLCKAVQNAPECRRWTCAHGWRGSKTGDAADGLQRSCRREMIV